MARKRAQEKKRRPRIEDQRRAKAFGDASDLLEMIFGALLHGGSLPPVITVQEGIPEGMFRKLLMLCHPDKHGNSEMSNEVTRWLIAQGKS